MKRILQNLKDGSTELAAVPCPRVGRGALLIRTSRTLISAGTKRMLVDFGKANPLEKARQQPEKVRQVLEKVRTDGLVPTLETVRTTSWGSRCRWAIATWAWWRNWALGRRALRWVSGWPPTADMRRW